MSHHLLKLLTCAMLCTLIGCGGGSENSTLLSPTAETLPSEEELPETTNNEAPQIEEPTSNTPDVQAPETPPSNEQTLPESGFATGLVNPKMGMGLNGISYWGSNFPFIDLMKQATAGEMRANNTAPNNLEPITFDEMSAQALLDENGWPTTIPENYYWYSIVTADAGNVPSQRGRYVLTYKGEGQVHIVTDGTIVSTDAREIIFDITADTLFIQVSIENSDPNNTGNYVRDIVLTKQEHRELYETGQLFNPQWLDLIKDLRVLRFMDWQFTNGSTETQWSERTKLASHSWGVTTGREAHKGVPLEAMVALANQTGTDPWFNFPANANDDYIRNFAAYVAEHLDPELIAYFEYSNEIWNWIFEQTYTAQEEGLVLFGDQYGTNPLREYYGYRSAEISNIVHQTFGEHATNRTHFTLATQTDDTAYQLERALVGAERYTQENNTTLAQLFKSVAVTWYFNIPADLDSQVAQWIENTGDAEAATMLFEQLSSQQQHFVGIEDAEQPSVQRTLNHIQAQATLASQYQLDVISYEGGTHLLGYEQYNESLSDFFISVNNDERMGDLYAEIYQGWQAIDEATLLTHFVDVAKHTRWGSWGALRHLEDSSARWDFIVEANETLNPWENRSEFAFDNGIISFGSDEQNNLQGTSEEDYLIGMGGDDILYGGEKNDGLHGGDGNDVLSGGDGDDILVGGPGSDQLAGGEGYDTFIFTSSSENEIDTITDFNTTTDRLDFRFITLGPSASTINDYISVSQDGDNTLLWLDQDGPATDYSPIAIVCLLNSTLSAIENLNNTGRILL